MFRIGLWVYGYGLGFKTENMVVGLGFRTGFRV